MPGGDSILTVSAQNTPVTLISYLVHIPGNLRISDDPHRGSIAPDSSKRFDPPRKDFAFAPSSAEQDHTR